jgi:hypothetical protein
LIGISPRKWIEKVERYWSENDANDRGHGYPRVSTLPTAKVQEGLTCFSNVKLLFDE